MKYIIGNWKSNKNTQEIKEWFKTLANLFTKNGLRIQEKLNLVICPPFPYLSLVKELSKDYQLPIEVGAQDVSPFEEGAYTGEVSAKMLSEFANYVIIGHSERRQYFKEEEKILKRKVEMAAKAELKTIFCISQPHFSSKKVFMIAYEPLWAIGSGKTETPENMEEIAFFLKKEKGANLVAYGGSITPANVKDFLVKKNIDGVLLGGSSLNPETFWEIIVNVASI